MPGSFLNIDTNFPTFKGQESSREQVQEMLNYLRQLVDQLRYTLKNLDQSNFNRTALDEIATGSAGSIAEQVQTLAQQLNQTNSHVANLNTRIGTAEGNITTLQGNVSNAQGNITTLQSDMTAIQGAVNVDENTGDITIGGTGIQVNIVGDVHINGTPQ